MPHSFPSARSSVSLRQVEVPWDDIASVRIELKRGQEGVLALRVARPPLLFRERDPQVGALRHLFIPSPLLLVLCGSLVFYHCCSASATRR